MEKGTRILIADIRLGERYSMNKSFNPTYIFVVTSIDLPSIEVKFLDNSTGLYFTSDKGSVFYFPYTELEKALV